MSHPKPPIDDLEAAFFGADAGTASGPDGAHLRGRAGVLALLMVVLAGIGAFSWREAAYFFTPSTPVAVGETEDLAAPGASDRALPDNRYVSVAGAPEREAGTEKVRYFKLVGADIYVETELTEAQRTQHRATGPMDTTDDWRTAFDGAGRLRAFGSLSRKYQGVLSFYAESYGVPFCGYEGSPALRARALELAERSGKTLEEACVRGYLLEAGYRPRDAWWAVLVQACVAAGIAACALSLWKSLRRRG